MFQPGDLYRAEMIHRIEKCKSIVEYNIIIVNIKDLYLLLLKRKYTMVPFVSGNAKKGFNN